jgi:AcrR family transcriptional regulator
MLYTVTRLAVKMNEESETELPRGLALAWGVAAAPQRGPKREMSIERIVEASVDIADESGLAAVSMAAVAARFDVTPMALYRYVSAKDDLVMLMYEYAIGLPPVIDPAAPWRESVETWARAQFDSFAAHPWMLDIPVTGPPLTPNGLAWTEAGVTAVAGSGLTGGERLSAILAVSGQMQWLGQLTRRDRGTPAMAEGLNELFKVLVLPDAYPGYYDALFGEGPESDPFAFAITVTLEGIAAVADGRAPVVAPADVLPEQVRKDRKVREAAQRRRERERELLHAIREEQRAIREARRNL